MRRIGLTLATRDLEAPLSGHFCSARWILIYDLETGELRFERNRGLVGASVIESLASDGCTDAIFAAIDRRSLRCLERRRIRAWHAPIAGPALELVPRLFEALETGDGSPPILLRPPS